MGNYSERSFEVHAGEGNPRSLYHQEIAKLKSALAAAQRKLAKKTSEMEQGNKRNNMMLGMAAHDLRNPLTAIQGFSSLLLEDHEEQECFTERQLDYIREIHASSKLMVRIIEDLLDFSAIESGKVELHMEEVNLAKMMRHTASLYRAEADRKDIALQMESLEAPFTIIADRHKLEQVLNNLFSNAIRYSKSGTTVTLGLQEDSRFGRLVFFVRDDGLGIPEEDMDKLFQPFAKLQPQPTAGERSTGLGLTITRKIVQAHGGRIWAESEVGVGSTFYVSLPKNGSTG